MTAILAAMTTSQKWKYAFVLSASLMLLAFLTGCGSSGSSPTPNPTATPTPSPTASPSPTPTPTPPSNITINFAPPFEIDTGGDSPNTLLTADFNGDGLLDLAVSNSDNTVKVFLGQGGGSFGSPLTTPINDAISTGKMVVGDLDEDGVLDLIVGTVAGDQKDLLFLGNGDGTFQPQAAIPNSHSFNCAQLPDLNADGHLDLVECGAGNAVAATLGHGDGTFGDVLVLTLAPPPQFGNAFDLNVNDFNQDGKLDIVAADYSNSDLHFFAGNGDGTFQSSTAVSFVYSSPVALAAADFSGDGKLDLAIGYHFSGAYLAWGAGDGTFGLADQVSIYGPPQGNDGVRLAVADMNLDQKPDLLMMDFDRGILALVQNPGTGTFTAEDANILTYTLTPGLVAVTVGDFNQDQIPDMAVLNGPSHKILVFLSVPAA